MNRQSRRLLIELLRPVAVPIGIAAKGLYWLLFGWWLDKYQGRRGEKQLLQDVENALPFLFAEYNGRVVPNEGVQFPEPFDCATITVALENLLFRFVRGQGELGVNIAPAGAPHDWHELSLVLAAVNGVEELERRPIVDLWRAAALLQPNISRLIQVFASRDYDRVKRQLAEVYKRDRAAMREWEAEINARLR